MSFFNFSKRQEPTEALVQIKHESYFNELFNKEFSRLGKQKHVYLDYTGGGLYATTQLRKHHEMLESLVLGNPHSSNPSSKKSTELVEESRQAVLDFFDADDYCCVFTQNASGALKIVGECYPFNEDACFSLLMDNHNSVNGIREFAVRKNAKFYYCNILKDNLRLDEDCLAEHFDQHDEVKNKLFAYPAQSNVSGVKHDLKWVKYAEERGWDILLDAAAFVPTSKLDLSQVKPSFVAMSFYKIFGYPTGLGCLLIRKDKFHKLEKPWFAGGTVSMVSNTKSKHFLAESNERYEDGTLNYLDIPAIKIGLDFIKGIGIEKITERVTELRKYLYNALSEIKHDNGNAVARIYGPTDYQNIGGTIIFNVMTQGGETIFFDEVEKEANKELISLRTGCFCNPGIDEINNEVSSAKLTDFYKDRSNANMNDALNFFDFQRGAVRISVGIATRQVDLDKFIQFIIKNYQNK